MKPLPWKKIWASYMKRVVVAAHNPMRGEERKVWKHNRRVVQALVEAARKQAAKRKEPKP